MFLTKDSFLAINATPPQPVEVPGHGTVLIREMTAGERNAFGAASQKDPYTNFTARLVAAGVCDESGALVFGREDIATITNLPGSVLEPIAKAVIAVNKMAEKDVEDVRKNSESATA